MPFDCGASRPASRIRWTCWRAFVLLTVLRMILLAQVMPQFRP